MIKTLNKVVLERDFLNLIKGLHKKKTSYLMMNNCTLSPKVRKKTGIPPLATYTKHYTGNFSQGNWQEKEIQIPSILERKV